VTALDRLLGDARSRISIVSPEQAAALQRDGAVLVDIRPSEQRRAHGTIPHAIAIDRNVLEWRLDPTSAHRVTDVAPEQPVVLVCNEGYASTLAAATLRRLGLRAATDLDGGYQAWLADRNG
jgi:rhodanese-related sulfurtransferase